jgi:acyl carrier protein
MNPDRKDLMDLEIPTSTTIDAVKAIVVETLEVEDRADSIDAATPLMQSLPELDSMAVMELVVALEDRFGIAVEGEDVTAEVFDTLTSLAAFVDGKLA